MGARPGRARHLVLQRPVPVRHARLARRDRRAEGVLSHRRALDGARHPLPVGRPDGHVRAGVRGRHPVRRRLRALDHPGAGRPPDVEVARHRDRPAGPDRRRPAPAGVQRRRRLPGLRRRRRPLRAAGHVLHAGRALQRVQDRRGPAAGEQALQRLAARAAAGAGGRDRAVGGAGAADRRGPLDPLAPAGRRAGADRGLRRVRVPPGHAAAVRLHLRRAVRLVPGDAQAAAVCGGQPGGDGIRLVRARADAGDRASGDPVRDRGDLVLRPRLRRAADGASLAARGRGAARPRRRGRGGARDRGDRAAARLARPGARGARDVGSRAAGGRGLRPRARAHRAAGPLRVLRERGSRPPRGRDRRRPRRPRGRAALERRRPGGREGARGRARRPAAQGDRARGGQARQPGLRGQGAGGRRRGRAREAGAVEVGAGGARSVTWDLGRAEEHLLSLELFGMRFGLERMRRLLTVLGSPQERFGAVHVVGTNGKSSTVRMTAALLQAHGLRTGAYLSPHLTTFAERIRVGDEDLAADAFGPAIERAAAAAAKVDRTLSGGERVTQFELLTAAAFAELARREVDVAVVEAGLGGRWDATNVLGAPVVVLTNVGLEHTRWLGPTIPDIAAEKLAVVRPGATLVLGEAQPEVDALARETGAVIVRPEPVAEALPGYQRANFAAAVAAAGAYLRHVAASSPAGLPATLDPATVTRVAAHAQVPGRLQVIAESPRTILDGAHNPSGIAALVAALPEAAGERPVTAVVSILDDKDAGAMLRELIPAASQLVFTG